VLAEFCAANLWPGVGETTAGRIADAGILVPDDVTAERLAKIDSIAEKRAEKLAEAFANAMPAYEAVELFVPARVPARFAGAAVRELGAGAADRLRANPWLFLSLPAAKPEQADYFARQVLGAAADPADPRRGRALVAHLLSRAAREGHTAQPAAQVASGVGQFNFADGRAAVEAALEDGTARLDDTGDRPLVTLARYADAEETIAEGIARLVAESEPLSDEEAVVAASEGLDDTQRHAVLAAAAFGVSVLTGGPGTGKSRTVAAIVELTRSQGLDVALAAPTGRAAKRLEELTGAPASTLHRLLGAQGTTGAFSRGPDWPVEAELIVVDEASMLDAELCAALLDACAEGSHLLLVGDPAQLPSIGAGRVLADIIASGTVPVTELTKLYRQREGGDIAKLATAVRGGDLVPVPSPEKEVVIVPARESAEAAHRVVQLVTDSIPRALSIQPEDIQVVTPVHRGPAGTKELNKALKAKLNPGAGEHAGFDVGDRVVATANHVDEGFANGEVGLVSGTDGEGGLQVVFTAGPVTVRRKFLGDLLHGWALTVHRAQGSEWGAVVGVFTGEAGGMLSRPLVYTALTRARHHLSVVHAAGPALARAVKNVGERPRLTRLVPLLKENVVDPAAEAEPEAEEAEAYEE
jgi:exodeoxyribonuclease V alpha subunit